MVKKILLINCGIHEKNKQGLVRILKYLKIEYKTGSVADIPSYDIIYSPSEIINTSLYPHKQFIFGPHFSTFPNGSQLHLLQNVHYNSIYIQPSDWVIQLWKNMGAAQVLHLKPFPFPIDTEKFKPRDQADIKREKTNVLVYYKHRHPHELDLLKAFLAEQTVKNYRIFDYKQRYKEEEYLSYLQECNYGIILDAHESQGFAIEEALACNVPLLVWNAQTMSQEYGANYKAIPCTSIPYWSEHCGEYFHHYAELPAVFELFQRKLQGQNYAPRQYIVDNLSTEKCAERFMELII